MSVFVCLLHPCDHNRTFLPSQPLGVGSRSVLAASSASPALSEQSPIVRRDVVDARDDEEEFKRPLSLVEVSAAQSLIVGGLRCEKRCETLALEH